MDEDLKSYLDRKLRIGKLDSALLFLSSSIGIVFGLVQGLSDPGTGLIFLVPVLVLGWGLPFYYGYLLGAVRRDSMVDRYRGWIFLVAGVGTYGLIFSTQLLSRVITTFPPILITGPGGLFLGWYMARHGPSLANFIFATAGEKPSMVDSEAGETTAGAALLIALGSALLVIFRDEPALSAVATSSLVFAIYFLRKSEFYAGRVGQNYTVVELKGRHSGSNRMKRVARAMQLVSLSTLVLSWVMLGYEEMFPFNVVVAERTVSMPVMTAIFAAPLMLVAILVTESTRIKRELQFSNSN